MKDAAEMFRVLERESRLVGDNRHGLLRVVGRGNGVLAVYHASGFYPHFFTLDGSTPVGFDEGKEEDKEGMA